MSAVSDPLHTEAPDAGNVHRSVLLKETRALLRRRQQEADITRALYFQPDVKSIPAYTASTRQYREKLVEMLGWPLDGEIATGIPSAREEFVAEDALGKISRVWIETMPGVHLYGLFFLPPGEGPFPFVMTQHGGQGTPELCANFFGSGNYNDMTRRVLRRGYAVFAPQVMLWNTEEYGPEHHKLELDKQFKQVGGSIASLEIFKLRRALDYFCAHPQIDPDRVGMVGLSYGGFYTLFTSALDLRIRVAVSSCFFNDRKRYCYDDWVWFDSASHMTDPEIASLVCPRPLFIEIGANDDLFDAASARPLVDAVARRYRSLGIADRFAFHEHSGGHEFNRTDEGIDFLCRYL